MTTKPLICRANDTSEDYLRRMFSWLTRIGASPAFGSRPIGWYQKHQCNILRHLEQGKALGCVLRCKHGMIQAKPTIGKWFDVATVEQLWTIGDSRD